MLAGFISLATRFGQFHVGVNAKGQQFLDAEIVILQLPVFRAIGFGQQKQTIRVREFVVLLFRFGPTHSGISEWHFGGIDFGKGPDTPICTPPMGIAVYGTHQTLLEQQT